MYYLPSKGYYFSTHFTRDGAMEKVFSVINEKPSSLADILGGTGHSSGFSFQRGEGCDVKIIRHRYSQHLWSLKKPVRKTIVCLDVSFSAAPKGRTLVKITPHLDRGFFYFLLLICFFFLLGIFSGKALAAAAFFVLLSPVVFYSYLSDIRETMEVTKGVLELEPEKDAGAAPESGNSIQK